jgi:hypothetical protein
MEQTDIRYRHDATWGWLPDSWVQHAYLPNGVVLRTNRVDVLELRINEPQPAELFDITFPTGCLVLDQRESRPTDYEVQPDGSWHRVRPTDEMLRRMELANQPQPAWYWRYKWLLAGFAVVCAGLVWQYAVRRKRRIAA